MLKPHFDISDDFPILPALFKISKRGRKDHGMYEMLPDGSVTSGASHGSWWPHSSSCFQVTLGNECFFFRCVTRRRWESRDKQTVLTFSRTCKEYSKISERRSEFDSSFPNMSRFRTSILPLHQLDTTHRDQLDCMGLRVCYHSDVGRVLVAYRAFQQGEIIINSRVSSFDVQTDAEVFEILKKDHPTSCYLLVPRKKKLYYNRDTFSDVDPIRSDLWYLVNHSSRPNLDIVLHPLGLRFRAKRAIQKCEPLMWTYPSCFFGRDETPVDLPQFLVPDIPAAFH
jgi:hypothetical protein